VSRAVHLLVFLLWGGIACHLALQVALCGAEEARLAQQRGADLDRRKALAFERAELRSRINWEGRLPRIRAEILRLGLELLPPGVDAAGGAAVLTAHRIDGER